MALQRDEGEVERAPARVAVRAVRLPGGEASVEAAGTRDELLAESRAAHFLREPRNDVALAAIEAALTVAGEGMLACALAVVREAFCADAAALLSAGASPSVVAAVHGPRGPVPGLEALAAHARAGAGGVIVRRLPPRDGGALSASATTQAETIPRCSLIVRLPCGRCVVADRRQGKRYDRRDLALIQALGERLASALSAE